MYVKIPLVLAEREEITFVDQIYKGWVREIETPPPMHPDVSVMFIIIIVLASSDFLFLSVITPHAQLERGKVIGRGVHILYNVCGPKKILNRTLEIDSPFQTLTVGLLVEFID